MCEPMGCPGDSIKDNSTSPATCKCRAEDYGDGFAWQEGSTSVNTSDGSVQNDPW